MIQNNLDILDRLKAIEESIGLKQMMTDDQIKALKLAAQLLQDSNSEKSPLDLYYDIRKLAEKYGGEELLNVLKSYRGVE